MTDADAGPELAPAGGSGGSIEVDLVPLRDLASLGAAWRDLEARADGSFFLSWLWISTWLEHLPRRAAPYVLTARSGGRIVGLAVLCRASVWRHRVLRCRCWLLHETGDPLIDRLTTEYNGILADRRCAEAVAAACLEWLARNLRDWDELVLGGIGADVEAAARRAARAVGALVRVRRDETARGVDLARVRHEGGDYRAGLGRNTRAGVGRAERLYAARGRVSCEAAGDLDQALEFFAEMEVLHQASWRARGRPGAFDNPVFAPMHRRLIRRGLDGGLVRLCRISAGERPIGFLYNFVWRGRVLNYQSGFAYEPDNRLKPGLLSHVLAIEDALARGESYYDFMAGGSGHKLRLANDAQPMRWIAFGPDRLAGRADAALEAARRRLSALRGRAGGAARGLFPGRG